MDVMDLSVVIQAGGESRRMGQSKAQVPFLGRPLIERMVERLSGLGEELFITCNDPVSLTFLNLPCVPDVVKGRGALGGLFTALSHARCARVAVVACDLPFASRGILRLACQCLEDADAAIPESAGGLEPFHAVYRRETCLAAVQEAMEAGEWRVQSWLSRVRIRRLAPVTYQDLDPEGRAFLNVNTLEELMAAEKMAKS